MVKQQDKIFQLIDSKYFKRIRSAILIHGKINIQLLASKFNIRTGNTYFRNFINDQNQDYLGPTGLNLLLDTCGYELKVVPVKKGDTIVSQEIEDITDASFDEITKIVSRFAQESKKTETKKKKKKKENIINADVIGSALFDLSLDDDDDDDEILIG